jgi:hypothetical protein
MKTQKARLAIHLETLKPLVLDRVTGGGIAEITTVTTATTSTTMYQTRWCKTGGK